MNTAHDVAKYIIKKLGTVSAMKLQKLVYYSQAWSLVWDERPLFKNKIEAWANGPVVPALYNEHRGRFLLSAWPLGDDKALDDDARETIDGVIEFYAKMDAQQLSDLTHREDPWRDARKGLPDGVRGSATISEAALAEYYGGL